MKTNRTIVGVDTAKRVFQLYWVDMETGEIIDLKLTRAKFLQHFANRVPCLIGMEACGGSQHWARRLRELGHEVRLLPAKMVRPFVGGNKSDAHDARATWTGSAAARRQDGCDQERGAAGDSRRPWLPRTAGTPLQMINAAIGTSRTAQEATSATSCAPSRWPDAVEQWSLTSLREKLIKIGATIVRHGRYVTFRMAEVVIPRDLFADILRRIDRLRPPPAPA